MPKPLFLAAPDANAAEVGAIDKLLVSLEIVTGGAVRPSMFFVPHLQAGEVGVETDAARYFTKCLTAVQEAQVVVALVDGAKADDGVAFLVGYAFAAQKPVIAVRTDRRQSPHPLIATACTVTVGDAQGLAAALAPIFHA